MKNDMSWIKRLGRIALYFSYLGVVVFILLELVFRVLPVSDALYVQPVNNEQPNKHFKKNTSFLLQIGYDFSHHTVKRSNNYGYLTDIEFTKEKNKGSCRHVVIGDSYVEAIHVPNKDTFHGILNEINECEFYAIGASGDPLSQYLSNARFAVEEFNPDKLIFIVISNDFDESWIRYKNAVSIHYFDESENLVRNDFYPSILGRIVRKSSLFRYLFIDLKIQYQFAWLLKLKKIEQMNQMVDSAAFKNPQERQIVMNRAAELFLINLQKISQGRESILVLDGDRSAIYAGHNERNMDVDYNRAFLHLKANAANFESVTVLDLHEIFLEDWKINGKMFNYHYDFHWNDHGHYVVAYALNNLLKQNNK